jgi:hypothetical protein
LPVRTKTVQKKGLAKDRQLPVQDEERDEDVHCECAQASSIRAGLGVILASFAGHFPLIFGALAARVGASGVAVRAAFRAVDARKCQRRAPALASLARND